jgi:hypothetical protein
MNQKKLKLIQLTALGIITSAIALISVEIIPATKGSHAPIAVELNIGKSAQALKCNNACRKATAKAAARFSRAIWRGRNREQQQQAR